MSIYPVTQALIPPDWTRDPPITPRLLIFHTAVSNAAAPGPSAPDAGGLEWHFYIAESGEIVQRRDTGEEADANFHANSFVIDGVRYGAISVETWDGGDPEGNPWNDAQVASIVRLCHLANQLDAIPLVRPDAWNGTGVGYHRQYPEWNSPYHSCPGNTRAAQFDNDIWPLVLQGDDYPMGFQEDVMSNFTEIKADILPKLRADLDAFKADCYLNFEMIRGVIPDSKTGQVHVDGASIDTTALAASIRQNLGKDVADELAKRLTG